MTAKPPRFRSVPCSTCSSHIRINDPATQEGERSIRRDERRLIAAIIKRYMRPDELLQVAKSERPLIATFAQAVMEAIAEREADDAG